MPEVFIPEPLFIVQPEELEFMVQAALMNERDGDYAAMEKILAGTVLLEPGNARLFVMLGRALQRQGKWPEAEQAYRRAEELAGGFEALACVGLVEALIATRRPQEAAAELRRYLELCPGDIETSATLQRTLEVLKDIAGSAVV